MSKLQPTEGTKPSGNQYQASTERTRALREKYKITKHSVCPERAVIYTESYKETEGQPAVLRQAKAFEKFLNEVTIYISDNELIVGSMASRPNGTSLFPEYDHTWIEAELDIISTRVADPYYLSKEDKEKLLPTFDYWRTRSFKFIASNYGTEECKKSANIGATNCDHLRVGAEGHLVPGHDLVLEKGFNGLVAEAEERLRNLDLSLAEDFKQLHFLQAAVITGKAVIKYAERYAALAKEKAAMDINPQRRAELEKIAEVCSWVPANPARNLWEALQVFSFNMFTVQMEGNGLSITPGRLDQYLYPYYQRDLFSGKLTREQAVELLECLYIKLAENTRIFDAANVQFFRGYQNWLQVTIGGQTKDGYDATNELSYIFLDITANLKLSKPTTSVRIHKRTPEQFLIRCLEVIKEHKGGMPAVYNDEVGIPSKLAQGITKEDAYDWCIVGCAEKGFMGKGFTEESFASYVNEGKIMEMAIFGGKDPGTGIEIGPQREGLLGWKTYDDMWQAVVEQAKIYNKIMVEDLNSVHYTRQIALPTPYLSLLNRDCVKNGRSIMDGGSVYKPGGMPVYTGVANIGNSIAAIKKLVFDDKTLTAEQLMHALKTDYQDMTTTPTGAEIQSMCIAATKFGNDDDYVDNILKDFLNAQTTDLMTHKGLHGGTYQASSVPATAHIPFGFAVGTTPDGRRAGTPMADGVSPTQHTDVSGVTAAIKSVAKIEHVNFPGGTLYNVRINPVSLEDRAGMKKWADLVRTYFNLGGYHMQFNVVSGETYRAAQASPEKYRDLLARVAGYSAFFVMMDKALQDDIILRTEHVL